MRKIVILVLTFVLGIVNVNAYSVTKTEYGITKPCDYPIISNTEKCVSDKTYHVGNGETFHINYNGETLSGYCIDPGLAGPKNVVEVSTAEISEHIESFKHICEKTEGNEILRGAMMKAYSVRNGLGKVGSKDKQGTIDAYNKLGSVTKFNEKYDINGNALDILKTAESKKGTTSKTSVDPSFSNAGGVLTLTTEVVGTLEIASSENYEILINGTKQTSPYAVTKAGTYKIQITNPTCVGDETIEANVSFKYEKDDLPGSSSSSYNVRYFHDEVNKSQRLITCEKLDDGENPNCVGNDCKIDGKTSVPCSGETCDEIEFKNGAGVCNETGTTVVTVIEKPNDVAYANSTCITKLPDATRAILADDDNDYCKIYCSENYELILPGPDAKAGDDKNVFINAGSYFTIDDSNMKDKTTFTCFGKMNLDEYKNDLKSARNLVVTAYNELSYLKGYKKALQNAKMTDTGCQVTGSYRELYFDGDVIKERNTSFPDGKDLPECPVDNVKESDIKTLETNLQSAIAQAEKTIKNSKEDWDNCINWNFDELNKLLAQDDCNTNIDFNYQFDACGVTIDKIDFDIPTDSLKENKSISTNPDLYTGLCDVNGSLAECNKKTEDVAYTYINKQETVIINYEFDNDFTVNFETGELSCDAQTGDKYSDVIEGFPVSIEATQAKYAYEYKYTNIGHDFNVMNAGTCSMGRFDSIIKTHNSHSCYYDVNNCGDCEVECVDPTGNDCNFDFCDGECQVACVGGGCILDINAGFLATYRTMSLNDPFPNTVAMISSDPSSLLAVASTKDYEANYDTNWTTEKGIEATTNIENIGEEVYGSEPQYSITLTPTIINEIRKYNDEHEDKNGYLNKTLECIDAADKNYGQCISTFVHEKNEKWKFEINNTINSTDQINVEIDGVIVPFVPYDGVSKAFVGPAWK